MAFCICLSQIGDGGLWPHFSAQRFSNRVVREFNFTFRNPLGGKEHLLFLFFFFLANPFATLLQQGQECFLSSSLISGRLCLMQGEWPKEVFMGDGGVRFCYHLNYYSITFRSRQIRAMIL